MTLGPSFVKPERATRDFVAGVWLNIGIAVWRNETRAEEVRFMSEVLGKLASKHPNSGIGFVQVVETTCEKLDATARMALADLLRAGRSYLRCSTVVYEGETFRAAAVRMIVTGFVTFVRPGFPHHVFSTVAQAAKWQASHLMPKAPAQFASELGAAITHARGLGLDAPMLHRLR
jgi:hypothetical protein